MNWDHVGQKILITGKSGSGKSTFFLRTLRDWRCRWKFVFDPDRETARKLNWPVCVGVKQMEFCASKGYPVVFDPSEMFPGYYKQAFDFFCRWIFAISKAQNGPKLFAVDEIQKWTKPRDGGIPQSLQDILDTGRREELDLLFISQRPNRVNDAIRGQLSEVITFCHTDKLPLAWLAEDDFDPEIVKRLAYPGGFVRRNVNTGAEKTVSAGGNKPVQMIWTKPIRKPSGELSAFESGILNRLAMGHKVDRIAADLKKHPGTIKYHLGILRKTYRVTTNLQLMTVLSGRGLVSVT